jgi:hypothetical protein
MHPLDTLKEVEVSQTSELLMSCLGLDEQKEPGGTFIGGGFT